VGCSYVPYPEQHHWIYITIVIAAIFAYGGVLTLGMPAFFVLRALNHTSLWIALVLGFGIGVVTGCVFLFLFGLSLGNRLSFVWQDFAANVVNWPWPFLLVGALGAVVGATLWLIARPDRAARPEM
jgi:hypothetical protein